MMHESEGYKDRKIKRLEEEVDAMVRVVTTATWLMSDCQALLRTWEQHMSDPSYEGELKDRLSLVVKALDDFFTSKEDRDD